MIVYLSKSKTFIECLEIKAITVERETGGSDYIDILADLSDGSRMSLINKRAEGYSNYPYDPQGQVDEEEKESTKEVWEKIMKTLLSGKVPSVKL